MKEKCDKAFYLYKNDSLILFRFGNHEIFVCKERRKSESYCYENEKLSPFDYQGVQKVLIQNPRTMWNSSPRFTPKLIIVIQMK